MSIARIPLPMRPTTFLDDFPSHPRRTSARPSLATRISLLLVKWRRSHVQLRQRYVQQVPSMLTLPEGTSATVVVKEPLLVFECTEGVVWITHDAISGDHILAAGQRFVASARGRAVVYAFAASRVDLSALEERREPRMDEEEGQCLSHE